MTNVKEWLFHRWKFLFAISLAALLIYDISIRINDPTVGREISWRKLNDSGLYAKAESTRIRSLDKKAVITPGENVTIEAQLAFRNQKKDLLHALRSLKDERLVKPASVDTATEPPRTLEDTTSIPLPGIVSMDSALVLPSEVPLRPNSKEPILKYSQQRDYKSLTKHEHKCGNSSRLEDISLKTFDFEKDLFMLLVVKSSCAMNSRREAVRMSWGDEKWIKDNLGVNMKRVFLLGDCTTDKLREDIIKEDKQYGDILQWNFFDSFRNLTLKDCLFLQWFTRNCQNVPYVFKGDDDVFVNLRNIVQYLKNLPVEKRTNLFLGSVLNGSPRILDPSWKYYVSYNLYPEKYYPPYVSGGGFVMSGSLAVRLFGESLRTRIIPIDDAFLGILLKGINVKPQNDKGFKSWGMKIHDVCRLAKIKTFHKILPDELRRVWNEFIRIDVSKCDKATDDVFRTQTKR